MYALSKVAILLDTILEPSTPSEVRITRLTPSKIEISWSAHLSNVSAY